MRKFWVIVLAVLILVILVGCAAGPNQMQNVPTKEEEVAGFWLGLWHGIIAPVTFVISLFNDKVSMYEIHNNGGWYNFGFLFGMIAIWGGGGGGAGKRSRKK